MKFLVNIYLKAQKEILSDEPELHVSRFCDKVYVLAIDNYRLMNQHMKWRRNNG